MMTIAQGRDSIYVIYVSVYVCVSKMDKMHQKLDTKLGAGRRHFDYSVLIQTLKGSCG